MTALVALPLTAALALGSLRITSETHDAQTYNSYAEDVHALPPVLLMADASAVVGGAMALGVPPTEQDLKAARDAVAKVEEIGAGGKLKRADNALHRLLDIVRGTVNSANAPTMPPPQTFFEGAKQMTDLVWQIVNLTLENLPDRDADEQAAILSDQIRAKFSLTEEVFAAGAVAMSPRISTSEYQLTGELKSAVATAQTTPLQIATEVERSLVLSLAGHRTIDPVKIKALLDGISHRQALAKEFGPGKSAPMVFMNNLRESLYQSVGSYNGIAGDAQKTLNIAVQNQYNRNRNAAQRDSILLAGGLVLELLLAALAARSLLVPLRRLRSSALSLADRDLPAEIERIREGANVDDVMPLPMPVHTTEEVGQLARAIDDVHEQALRLAGEQAQLRRQVSDMFETLARRSKSLVDHQLGVIEAMEYEEKDPKLLEGLFRLDHLAARMRRNSDNLLILAGTKARRTKAAPVEIGDVLRAAISEVEEYQRVKLGATPRGSLTEPAASDIAHLFAELLDNALRASPPETDVKFTFAQANDQGLLIEVADRGIGIPAADLAAINRRLEAGAEIGTETARHMGLFVVSRLAERHGLTVRMRPTFDIARDPGITVTVHVPRNLIVGGSVLASGKPVVTRPSALETTGSGQIKAITRTPGGNMMLTVDDGAERPDLPQRRPGGSILGDPPQRPERPVLPQRGELPQRSEL
ncbi:MAG: sensor histidine kinase, partial [Mycobacteriaceae bacterium]|nr:sensor histidine kinase [Mycobacteriaceae bacterium]